MVNAKDHHEYSYLFWEGTSTQPMLIDVSSGFVVPGKDTKSFLQTTLSNMGLTPKEYNEFIVYWFPKMEKNPYNFIHFVGKEYTDIALLTITPNPDSLLRVFMLFQRLDKPRPVTPQEFPKFKRNGFTVVEWGGMEAN